MRWLALSMALLLTAPSAQADPAVPPAATPEDARADTAVPEDATPHWHHRVAAGFTPLNLAMYHGSHAGLVDGPIDEVNVGAVGVSLSYAYAPLRYLEVKIQSEYLKPFPGRDALDEGLHEFRGVIGLDGVLPLGCDRLQLEVGIDGGLAAWRLTAIEEDRPDFDASHALGWTLSWHGGIRGYFTDHTGIWGQAGFGVADASHVGDAGNGLSARWPLRVTVGWADRF